MKNQLNFSSDVCENVREKTATLTCLLKDYVIRTDLETIFVDDIDSGKKELETSEQYGKYCILDVENNVGVEHIIFKSNNFKAESGSIIKIHIPKTKIIKGLLGKKFAYRQGWKKTEYANQIEILGENGKTLESYKVIALRYEPKPEKMITLL